MGPAWGFQAELPGEQGGEPKPGEGGGPAIERPRRANWEPKLHAQDA